jgi:hypothetical protein
MPIGIEQFLLIGMVFGIVLWIIFKYIWDMIQKRRWKVRVTVYAQRGNSIVVDFDERGRVIESKLGYSVLKLKKAKKNVEPPKGDVLMISTAAQPVYQVYSPTRGQYMPLKVALPAFEKMKLTLEDFEKIDVKKKIMDALNGKYIPVKMTAPPSVNMVEDSGSVNWGVQERRRIFEKYKEDAGFWAKYGMQIMGMVFMAVVIFMVIFIMTKFQVMTSTLSGSIDANNQLMEKLGNMITPGTIPVNPHPNATIVP